MSGTTSTRTAPGTVGPQGDTSAPGAAARLIAIGAVLGLAWTASLRSFMTQLAGAESTFTWTGTFAVLILPGTVAGAMLGWAEHLRRTGGRRGWRWLILTPMLLPAATLSIPGAFMHMLRTGQGTSSLIFTLLGMLGGIALSGRGPRWTRALCGIAGFALIPAVFLSPPIRPELDTSTAYGAWVMTLLSALLISLTLAAAIPMRRVIPCDGGRRRVPPAGR